MVWKQSSIAYRFNTRAQRIFYSGKHRCYGINLQALMTLDGTLIWISAGLPGSVNDTTAARHHNIAQACAHAGRTILADSRYDSLTKHLPPHHTPRVLTPYKIRRRRSYLGQ